MNLVFLLLEKKNNKAMPVGKCYWRNANYTKSVLGENYFPSIVVLKFSSLQQI